MDLEGARLEEHRRCRTGSPRRRTGEPAEAQNATNKAQTNQERSRHNNVALGGGGKFLQMFGGDATELRFFMNFEHTDATLHNNFEKEQREARELVSDGLSCVFSVDTACRLDPSRVLEMNGEELISRLP